MVNFITSMQEPAKRFVIIMNNALKLKLIEGCPRLERVDEDGLDLLATFRFNEFGDLTKFIEVGLNLPSQHQIGDKVKFSLSKDKDDFNAIIKSVHFYPGKVKYDLEIPIAGEQPTRVYNIDSCFVYKS